MPTTLPRAFLLQQMIELTEALQREPGAKVARRVAPDVPPGQLFIDMTERRKAGDSFGTIAHALNRQGVRGKYGGRWYGATVRNFIRRMQNTVTTTM